VELLSERRILTISMMVRLVVIDQYEEKAKGGVSFALRML
jgi:hypothetical protein